MTRRGGGLALAAAVSGTAFEWYDFFLYGTAAALVFPTLFFPGEDPLTGILLSFAVYATGFIARPLGGLAAGAFGDRYGRRRALSATLWVMGLATAAIGLLPGYAQIGIVAPLLLVALRFVQGIATGGEWGGAVLMALEHAPDRRGLRGGVVASSVYLGLILGNLAFVIAVAVLDEQALFAWGWRVPFLASLVLVAIGLVLRHRVAESPEFLAAVAADTGRDGGRVGAHPIADALRQPRNVIAVALVRIGQNASFYVISVFCLGYAATVLGMPKWVTLTALLTGASVAALLCPLWGAIGERIGAARLTAASLAGLGVLAVPLFLLLDTGVAALVIAVVGLSIGIVNAAADGVQPVWFASLFRTRTRYSGISIGREAGAIIGGGLTPLAATALVAWTGHWWPVAAMMIVAAALGVVGAIIARPVGSAPEVADARSGTGAGTGTGRTAGDLAGSRVQAGLGTTVSPTAISPVVSGASQTPK
ncbi:MFS transporter [Agromyces larvae]|uniref:MHS family MFS transporter n=1 Tax=Agromyces larvae TaxID=2929802 RepID=A0ABY4BYW3_9MICO|nr:MFS transporter [Agromyces larvae]UOE42913.1 MHS family MFS transporter [Agromyces larvae]